MKKNFELFFKQLIMRNIGRASVLKNTVDVVYGLILCCFKKLLKLGNLTIYEFV